MVRWDQIISTLHSAGQIKAPLMLGLERKRLPTLQIHAESDWMGLVVWSGHTGQCYGIGNAIRR